MRHAFPCLLLFAASLPAFASVDTGLLALVPSGAKTIGGVDVSRAKSSRFGQYILSKINSENEGLQELTQQTGFDPRRDVQDVMLTSTGPANDATNSGFGVLVRGNFDQSRIRKTLLAKGATIRAYEGVDVLVDTSNHGQNAFAFLDVDIAVMGDLKSVQQMIGNRASPSALDPALQQLVLTAGSNHDAWFASLGAGTFLSNNFKRNNFSRQSGPLVTPGELDSIVQSSGGVSLGDMVQVSFDALARSLKDATSLVDVIRFGASMMQMQRQQNTGADMLASALDNMTLSATGSNVHIAFSVPESSLEQLAELKDQRRSKGFRPTNPSRQ